MKVKIPLNPPKALSEAEVQDSIQRIETALLQELQSQGDAQEEKAVPQISKDWGLRFWLGWGSFATAVACVFFVFGSNLLEESLPALESQGKFASAVSKYQKIQDLQTSKKHDAILNVRKRWRIEASAGANFQIKRESGRVLRVKLLQKAVELSIRPNTMKLVEVECAGIRVIVKGTVFSVERGKRWMRVEVTRGFVSVLSKKKKEIRLKAGYGVRYSLPSRVASIKYQIPHDKKAFEKRMKLLEKASIKQLFLYGSDLSEMQKGSMLSRYRQIDQIARILRKKRHLKRAENLWLSLSRASVSNVHQGQALFQAALVCQKRKALPSTCLQMLARYFKRFPQGAYVSFARRRAVKLCAKMKSAHPTCSHLKNH